MIGMTKSQDSNPAEKRPQRLNLINSSKYAYFDYKFYIVCVLIVQGETVAEC